MAGKVDCDKANCIYRNRGVISCLESSKHVPWDAVKEVLASEVYSDAAKYLYLKLISVDDLRACVLYTWSDGSEVGVKVRRVLEELTSLPYVEATQSDPEKERITYTFKLRLPELSD